MPQLGCNFSPQLISLINNDRADVDWIKLSRWETYQEDYSVARPLHPILLHVLPHAGKPSFDEVDWGALNSAVHDCGSPHIALHLASMQTDWGEHTPTDREVVERMTAGAKLWASNMDVPLLVENVPYSGFHDSGVHGILRPATDPNVIRQICRESGVGLLLDLAHARVACWHRNEDVDAYLRALPLDRVREIHVCGPAMNPDGGLQDRHLEMQTDDYELLRRTLALTAPTVVSLEYGGTGPKFEWRSEIETLERQLNILDGIVRHG